MDFLNVMDLVTVDDSRTAADQATGAAAADKAQAQALGEALLAGKSTAAAEAAGQAAFARAADNWRVWYTVDPDVAYPAALTWLSQHGATLLELASKPEKNLVLAALEGDAAAVFTLKCRSFAPERVQPVLNAGEGAWECGLLPREAVAEHAPELQARELALEAARLFVTECIHQATGRAVGIKIAKSERWRL